MLTYIYAGKVYCEACGRAIREKLKHTKQAPVFPDNPWSYDSADYPKGPYYNDGTGYLRCSNGTACLSGCGLLGAIVGEAPAPHAKQEVVDPWTDPQEDCGGRDW